MLTELGPIFNGILIRLLPPKMVLLSPTSGKKKARKIHHLSAAKLESKLQFLAIYSTNLGSAFNASGQPRSSPPASHGFTFQSAKMPGQTSTTVKKEPTYEQKIL